MNSGLKWESLTVRAGLLGFVSGVLSCAMVESNLIYIVRLQKTVDNMVWPGIVFALVVLFPISRWAGDAWLRTAAALIASSAVYPVTFVIAVRSFGSSWVFMIAAFAFAGFLGSFVLAGVLLFGRPGWGRAAFATVVLGVVVGGLMGANLRAAMSGVPLPFSAIDGLGLFMVLWQALVGASLGRGIQVTRLAHMLAQ
jgi:hypothetical protein